MSLRTINFFDGFTSSTNPDITQVDVNSVVIFADDSGYESEYTATEGSMYYNTSLDILRYYNGADWVTIATDEDLTSHTGDSTIHFEESAIDHENILNIGSYTHGDIDSHIAASGAHGVTEVLGSSETQDISNKTFVDALVLSEVTTPSNPVSGEHKIYPKADNKLYHLDSSGVESILGAGGSGGYNYNDQDYDGGLGSTSTTDATNLAIALESSTPLLGSGSLKITKAASNETGEYVILKAFTLAEAHKASVFEVELGIKIESGTYNDSDLKLAIYDVTNSQYIEVTPAEIYLNQTLTARVKGTFQTSSNGEEYEVRLVVNNTATNAYNLLLDGFSGSSWYIGPQRGGVSGAVITDWQAYTPTLTNLTANEIVMEYKRDGEDILVKGSIAVNTIIGTIQIGLPSGLKASVPSYSLSAPNRSNFVQAYDASGNFHSGVAVANNLSEYFEISDDSTVNNWVPSIPFTWVSGDMIIIPPIRFKIKGWSSNTVMSEDAGNREIVSVASFSSTPSIPASTDTLLSFSPSKDTTASWISANEYIAPESGVYDITLSVAFGATTGSSPAAFVGRIYLDNVYYSDLSRVDVASAVYNSTISNTAPVYTLFPLIKGQSLKFYAFQNSSGASTLAYATVSIAKRSSPQTIAASEKVYAEYNEQGSGITIQTTETDLIYTDKVMDTHGAYNPSTGVFTAPRSGILTISASVVVVPSTPLALTQRIYVSLYKEIAGIFSSIKSIGREVGNEQALTNYAPKGNIQVYASKGDKFKIVSACSVATPMSITPVENYVSFSME